MYASLIGYNPRRLKAPPPLLGQAPLGLLVKGVDCPVKNMGRF